MYLIGNKAELEEEREITFDRAIEFARAHKISKVFETSAKTGNNVEDVFACAIKEIHKTTVKEEEEVAAPTSGKKMKEGKSSAPAGTKLTGDGGKTEKKKGCC